MPAMSKDALVSLTAAAANVATVAAMAFMVHKLSQLSSAAPASSTKKYVLNGDAGFTKQVSPVPELGAGATYTKDEGVTFNQDLTISDTPEAMLAMRAVFKRLCTSSRELLSVADVEKVHHLLGEPMSDAEKKEMYSFFEAKDDKALVVTFDMFMRWWSKLHDSTADPDEYYSRERYRQRFKVLQSRLKDPSIANITTVTEGEVTSRRFRVHYEVEGVRISPWHDIPLKNADGSYNFICEIPKWTRKKFEIATGEAMNPIKQDVKNGVLREYKWGDMLFNYGAFPQTWEDPKHISDETGCCGDNDPIDVIELGTRQRPLGSITRVKIIGVIPMIDSDETDWKILALAMDDDKAANIQDLNDLDAHMPGVTQALTEWLRKYKTAEGKGENKFGCGGKTMGAAFARKCVDETHEFWRALLADASSKGTMKKSASGNALSTMLTVDS
mmetsp:Transcript_49660/g.118262  ORF Transcript_49660/g.118262 Transcript_49660/m.118262 type:complete len:444 (-) Transcript_49660:186-1517(-)